MKCQNNYSDQTKQQKYYKSPLKHSLTGATKDMSNILEQRVDTEDIVKKTSVTNLKHPKLQEMNQEMTQENESATVGFPPERKRKIWKTKKASLEPSTLITKLSLIMDLVSTSKEKDLKPFWNTQSEEISKRLWLPTEIDCVDSVLNSLNESYKNTVMGKSWFSITKKHPPKKNSLMTSFQSSLFSHPESMDSEVIPSKTKSKKLLKTLKMRMFPTKQEKIQLQEMMTQFRWYYNTTLTIMNIHYGHENLHKQQWNEYSIRDIIRKYKYVEDQHENLIFKDFVYDEDNNTMPLPEWWSGKNKPHSRLSRGAVYKFIYSLNSAIANYKNGNTRHFTMNFRGKKSNTDYLHFEDSQYPKFLAGIKSRYWYTNRNRKRCSISLNDIDCTKRGMEIIYEKNTDRYFLHYPVDRDWFPEYDRRNDSQVMYDVDSNDRVISLDPGIRKFLVGYDPKGSSVFIGEGASLELTKLLLEIDNLNGDNNIRNNPKFAYKIWVKWKRLKNLVSELHWKTISFLVENYDTILLPDFRVSGMIRKRNLNKLTKRLMCMFSFNSFKEKLRYKCSTYGKKLIIVDESYTSCTCTGCGTINNTKGREFLVCSSCNMEIDRDIAGSRNIFIKNSSLSN